DGDVARAEAELGRLDATGLGLAAGRMEALRQRARGLAAVLHERRRSTERDQAAADQSLVAALESEAAGVTRELADVEEQARSLLPQADRVAAGDAALAA